MRAPPDSSSRHSRRPEDVRVGGRDRPGGDALTFRMREIVHVLSVQDTSPTSGGVSGVRLRTARCDGVRRMPHDGRSRLLIRGRSGRERGRCAHPARARRCLEAPRGHLAAVVGGPVCPARRFAAGGGWPDVGPCSTGPWAAVAAGAASDGRDRARPGVRTSREGPPAPSPPSVAIDTRTRPEVLHRGLAAPPRRPPSPTGSSWWTMHPRATRCATSSVSPGSM